MAACNRRSVRMVGDFARAAVQPLDTNHGGFGGRGSRRWTGWGARPGAFGREYARRMRGGEPLALFSRSSAVKRTLILAARHRRQISISLRSGEVPVRWLYLWKRRRWNGHFGHRLFGGSFRSKYMAISAAMPERIARPTSNPCESVVSHCQGTDLEPVTRQTDPASYR